jgi:hypothetical protein
MRRTGARRALAAAAISMAAFVTIGGGTAFAGEITGNGKSLKTEDGTLHGRSECAFSGQNDTYSGDPSVPDEDGFTRTQSWGQLPKDVRDVIGEFGAHPGSACNPSGGG